MFLLYVLVAVYQAILKLRCQAFSKTQRGLELLSLSRFLHDLWRKHFSCCILLSDQILFLDCLYLLLKILDNMCIVIICCSACDVMNFEINHRGEWPSGLRRCDQNRKVSGLNLKGPNLVTRLPVTFGLNI